MTLDKVDPFERQQVETNVALEVLVAGLFGRWQDPDDDSPAALALAIGLYRVLDALESDFEGVKEEALRWSGPTPAPDSPAGVIEEDKPEKP